ncbi:hypothetical protein [Propioniciclava soli]|uniref:hypothetical protein n=1 Tax=Propioniciclava soli TaxID=2775081 RepID=UPI001E2D5CE3|nr:hypothetical protein [Propioniciclava soli]
MNDARHSNVQSRIDGLIASAADEETALTLLEVGVALLRESRAARAGLVEMGPRTRQEALLERRQALTAGDEA